MRFSSLKVDIIGPLPRLFMAIVFDIITCNAVCKSRLFYQKTNFFQPPSAAIQFIGLIARVYKPRSPFTNVPSEFYTIHGELIAEYNSHLPFLFLTVYCMIYNHKCRRTIIYSALLSGLRKKWSPICIILS